MRGIRMLGAVAAALVLGTGAAEAAPQQSDAGSVKYIVVPSAANPDDVTLFNIARDTLGNGDRYREIFARNKGKPMPDGATFDDPAQIETGQVLVLPPDASGPGVRFGQLPTQQLDKPRASQLPPSTRPPTTGPVKAPEEPKASSGAVPVGIIVGGIGAVLVVWLGGFLLIRSRRRGATSEPEEATKPFVYPFVVERVDRPQETKELPESLDAGHEVTFDDELLRLDGPTTGIAWTPLPQIPPAGGSFVWLGSSDAGSLFTDLAAAPGFFALDGEPGQVAKLAGSIVHQAAELEHEDRPRILLTGELVPELGPGPGVHRFSTLEQCCRARAAGLAAVAEPAKFELVVTTAAELTRPGAAEAVRPAVVLAIGDVQGAGWRITLS